MAATRLIAMHTNKGRSIARCLKDRIDYAENGEKTDGGKYISSYECSPELADREFARDKQIYIQNTGRKYKGDIIAYQIRQSFKPGEIAPDEANKVGYETAMRFTKGQHAFIVATHTDRAHIHNHIIFNAVNLDCNRKFRDSWFIALALQKVSDHVCLEHGLSVIKPRKLSEREKRTEYPKRISLREEIRLTVDELMGRNPKSLEELLFFFEQEGYEVKRGKHFALKGNCQQRFIRLDSLGEGYTQEYLREKIEGSDEKSAQHRKRDFDFLIDIQKKLAEGKGGGYVRWSKVFNVKQVTKAVFFLQERGVRTYEKLAERADSSARRFDELSEKIKGYDSRLTEISEMRKAIINYSKTRDTYIAYRKSGYSKKFYEAHREEITIHKAAKEAFSEYTKGGKKLPKVKDLNAEFGQILADKKAMYSNYKQARKEMKDYQTAKYDIDRFLGLYEEEVQQKEQQQQKQNNQEL